jgi:DNA-binding transcriptional LysR family regulator
MEMHQVRYFLAVCETLNFTRAAARCNVSQPSLTQAVKKLEEELGGPLLHRERSNTHLTDLGTLMKPHLERILSSAEQAREQAAGFKRLDIAPLRVGVLCTIGPSRLVSLVTALGRQIPALDLQLHEGPLDGLIGDLRSGEIEAALLASPESLPAPLRFRPLYRERYVVAFPPGHRFEEQNTIGLHDMADEPYVSRTNCEYADHIANLLAAKDQRVDIRYRSQREDWCQSMILAGVGCAFMPEYLPLYPELPSRVVSRPKIVREIGLATVAGRPHSPIVQQFIRITQAHDWGY